MSKASEWLKSIKATFTATPGTAVTGFDKSYYIRQCAKQIYESTQRNEEKLKAESAKWKYETRETFAVLVECLGPGKFQGTTMQLVGDHQVVAKARSIPSLETELRYQLAQAFAGQKLTAGWDEARERAAKCELYLDTSQALGSK